MRLALMLGMTLARLDHEMGSSELELWKAYYELEPFGPPRDNHHAAMIAALIANVHRGKGQAPYSNEDFMLVAPEIKRKREDAEFLTFLESKLKMG